MLSYRSEMRQILPSVVSSLSGGVRTVSTSVSEVSSFAMLILESHEQVGMEVTLRPFRGSFSIETCTSHDKIGREIRN